MTAIPKMLIFVNLASQLRSQNFIFIFQIAARKDGQTHTWRHFWYEVLKIHSNRNIKYLDLKEIYVTPLPLFIKFHFHRIPLSYNIMNNWNIEYFNFKCTWNSSTESVQWNFDLKFVKLTPSFMFLFVHKYQTRLLFS